MAHEQQQIINKARRVLQHAIVHHIGLMDGDLPPCVRKEITPAFIFYHVSEGEYIVTFEHRGHKMWFERIEKVGFQFEMQQKARQFLLDMLSKEGTQAVLRHRYGADSVAILKAARDLLKV